MTPEEQAKIDVVTAKLVGERFIAKQRPIPPFDWYVWDHEEQAKVDAVTTALVGFKVGDRVRLRRPYAGSTRGEIVGHYIGTIWRVDFGSGLTVGYDESELLHDT